MGVCRAGDGDSHPLDNLTDTNSDHQSINHQGNFKMEN